MWQRYIDEGFEVINKGSLYQFTDHLNQTEPTCKINFTQEPEKDNQIPFLDKIFTRKQDGAVKFLIYRKATHTD